MKNLLLGAVVIIGTTALLSFDNLNIRSNDVQTIIVSEYEKGWKDGVCEGWKDVKGQFSNCPEPPNCPLPKTSCSEGYTCGYNRGFKFGMCKARGGNCEK
jgi:hypothetical protein